MNEKQQLPSNLALTNISMDQAAQDFPLTLSISEALTTGSPLLDHTRDWSLMTASPFPLPTTCRLNLSPSCASGRCLKSAVSLSLTYTEFLMPCSIILLWFGSLGQNKKLC